MNRQLAYLILALVFLAALVWAGQAESCPIVTRYVAPTHYVAPVHEVAVVQLIPIAITVPQYTVGYDYQGQQMREQLQALQAEVARLRGGAIPTPAPGAIQPTAQPKQETATGNRSQRGQLVLQNRCAKCHSDTQATAKGAGHVFFKAGQLLDLDKHAGLFLDMMEAGKMPKDGKLTDREFADALWALTVQEEKK